MIKRSNLWRHPLHIKWDRLTQRLSAAGTTERKEAQCFQIGLQSLTTIWTTDCQRNLMKWTLGDQTVLKQARVVAGTQAWQAVPQLCVKEPVALLIL